MLFLEVIKSLADKIKITYVDSEDKETCYMTREQWKYFGLSNTDEYIILTMGSASVHLKKAIVNSNKMSSSRLYLSKDIESQLYITQGTVLQIKSIDGGHLEIGPYIGIFVNQTKIELLKDGAEITEYTQFDTACKRLYGLCCFFSIENIDWDKCLIQGLVYIEGEWVLRTCLLPKIIYDRNVENNCRIESLELRKRLYDRCRVLNSIPKLAKWETINAIRQNENLTSLIPQTIQCNSAKDVESVLKEYSSAYLKPDALSKGKGIYKITKKTNNQYKVEYRTSEENHVLTLKEIENLEQLLNRYSETGGGYIIQKEINKALFRGNPFDLRLLFQKDHSGAWKISGIAARIAAKGSIITSPRSGGIVEDFSVVLKETFREDSSIKGGIYDKLLYFGREICTSIEKVFGDCVELGLDMAVDINRKIWVIEVNGKPLKVSLKRLNNPEVMARCNRRPIEYAVKLTGFASWDTRDQ
jgi:hypothetical protein